MTAESDQSVLRRFVAEDGQLLSIPSKRTKRLVVLDHVAQAFEPGLTYDEKQVNEALATYHPDFAALRRYLVDEQFLTREAGVYWRSGGTVEV
ncbi:DUF2087 domain-containing protein [Nocardioides speluncae]|uniref:DUF2087 domain-containing protein n=1 Tax=Nocardioides speluncae TaxID=2670337 RepID=UPI000D68D8F1|nr:DUF2087 domain-containing protein [Nocardioides speluncae]